MAAPAQPASCDIAERMNAKMQVFRMRRAGLSTKAIIDEVANKAREEVQEKTRELAATVLNRQRESEADIQRLTQQISETDVLRALQDNKDRLQKVIDQSKKVSQLLHDDLSLLGSHLKAQKQHKTDLTAALHNMQNQKRQAPFTYQDKLLQVGSQTCAQIGTRS